MNLLSLDTSTESCSAALGIDGRITDRYELAPRRHADAPPPELRSTVQKIGSGFALQTHVTQCKVNVDPTDWTCYTNQTLVTHYMSDFASRAVICTLFEGGGAQ